ncbi:MAG: SpoIID/LytB domain-containing protein [Deltaproteobacteria bacterium]|nr:SpoIID/LytB domain-containing protein [Deltaproteobacteria bacterium]
MGNVRDLFLLCCGFLAFSAPTDARGGPVGRGSRGHFASLTPLTLEDLYAKRMRFSDGEPMISVGISAGLDAVTLKADGPTRVMVEEGGVPKTVYAPPETAFSIRPISAHPATLRYWATVDTVPYGDGARLRATSEVWRARGFRVSSFVVGTIVALRGNVLDTREQRVVVGGVDREAQINALIADVFKAHAVRATVHVELVSLPGGILGVFDERGRALHQANDVVFFGTVEGGLIEVGAASKTARSRSRRRRPRFWGNVYVTFDAAGRLAVVNSVGAEALLAGLVPAEMFATAPLEALKAQAVTARGEIFSKLGHRHFGEPFHLCSDQHCQMYQGAGQERPSTTRAVRETKGLLAVRPSAGRARGRPLELVDSVYSAVCGGFSEANEIVWDHHPSKSLRPRLDGLASDPALAPFAEGLTEANIRAWVSSYPPTDCARSSFAQADKFRWRKTWNRAELDRFIAPLGVGELKDLEVLGRGPGGRVTGLRVVGTRGEANVLHELPVRKLFGDLRSGMFVLDVERDAQGGIVTVSFLGGGWGHGVGMCQVGAIGRAERGQSFRQILKHYYSGAVVRRIY